MDFKDYFSGAAGAYSRFRPSYPPELFSYLAHTAGGTHRAWDVATGSGQAAVHLAKYFDEVVGTDASAAQIQNAHAHPRVTYRVESAEQCSLPDASVNLVTVAQALHWLDLKKFYPEVTRVLHAGGIFAAWSYPLHRVDAEVDPILLEFYEETVGPYWPKERRHVEKRYESLPFPFPLIEAPAFTFTLEWNLNELLGYLGTWSACQRYRKATGLDPLALIAPQLQKIWSPESERRKVTWDLTLKLCRKP